MSIVTVRPTRWIVPTIAVLALVLAAAAMALAIGRTATVRSASDSIPKPSALPAVATPMTGDQLLQARWHDALNQPRAVLYRHFGLAPH